MRRYLILGMAPLFAGAVLLRPAVAGVGDMKAAGGQSYWEGPPGPITDPYWTSGQYKYDPDGYMLRSRWDPEYHPMTVIGDHSGKENCVFRRRVQNSDWDYRHPFLRVCRRPPAD